MIARGIRNRLTNFDVSGNFRSRLMGQHLSDAPHDITTLTFDLAGDGQSPQYFVLHLCTKFEVCKPFHLEDMTHFRSQHLVGLVTLTFAKLALRLVRFIASGVDNLSTNFGISRTFRSRLIGQHLSDISRDLATLTFDLGGHGTLLMRVFLLHLCTKLELRRYSRSEDIAH